MEIQQTYKEGSKIKENFIHKSFISQNLTQQHKISK